MNGKLRLLLFFLPALLVTGCAGPQQTRSLPEGVSDAEAQSEATTVIVQTEIGAQAAYEATARVLQAEGYALANTDGDLRSITTGRKSAEPNGILVGLPEHRISVSVTSSPTTVELRGAAFQNGTQSQIKKYGQSGSPVRLAWAQLVRLGNEVAKQIDGTIGYEQ